MKIVTFLPEKWFRTIKPISLQKQIAYQNIPKDQKIISIKMYKHYIIFIRPDEISCFLSNIVKERVRFQIRHQILDKYDKKIPWL